LLAKNQQGSFSRGDYYYHPPLAKQVEKFRNFSLEDVCQAGVCTVMYRGAAVVCPSPKTLPSVLKLGSLNFAHMLLMLMPKKLPKGFLKFCLRFGGFTGQGKATLQRT